jgi:hypothetical protein
VTAIGVRLVAGGFILLALPACAGFTDNPSTAELAAQAATMPPIGEDVRFYVYSHCGVTHAQIGGRWWQAVNPLSHAEGPGAPAGWDDPYQRGRLTVQSPERAVYEARGTEVVFVISPEGQKPQPCR